MRGSSPLTRGKRREDLDSNREDGLIPAHAGKTATNRLSQISAGAHPRSRGENTLNLGSGAAFVGSSPLTRGKQEGPARRERPGRLIPAHAGKTSRRRCRRSPGGAHPRSRGENPRVALKTSAISGSSPLTRGKLEMIQERFPESGLIPAHAGKTSRRRAPCRTRGAHPRSRGENAMRALTGALMKGSSPLTRGKPPRSRP